MNKPINTKQEETCICNQNGYSPFALDKKITNCTLCFYDQHDKHCKSPTVKVKGVSEEDVKYRDIHDEADLPPADWESEFDNFFGSQQSIKAGQYLSVEDRKKLLLWIQQLLASEKEKWVENITNLANKEEHHCILFYRIERLLKSTGGSNG